jgi:hypothetical protein
MERGTEISKQQNHQPFPSQRREETGELVVKPPSCPSIHPRGAKSWREESSAGDRSWGS